MTRQASGLVWHEHEKLAAKERQGTRNDLTSGTHVPDVQRARDKAGERVGVSGKAIDCDRRRAVVCCHRYITSGVARLHVAALT